MFSSSEPPWLDRTEKLRRIQGLMSRQVESRGGGQALSIGLHGVLPESFEGDAWLWVRSPLFY